MASSKTNFLNVDWTDLKRALVPYVERSVSGPWLRRYLGGALLLWLMVAGVSVFVTHDASSSLAQDWRESYRLESESKDAQAWHQCGYCVVSRSLRDVRNLREKLASISDAALERCAFKEPEHQQCSGVPWAIRSRLRDLQHLKYHAENVSERSVVRRPAHVWEVYESFESQAKAAKLRPRIERYRSPLDWSDYPAVFGLTCSLVLLFGVVVVLPFRVAVLLARELYHQTWMLLVATQQPVSRILCALVMQALFPLVLLGAPLALTSVALMAAGGQVLAAFMFVLALLALVSLWSAFGVTLPALMGRHLAPSFLTLFCLGVSAIYFFTIINVGEFVANSHNDLLPRLWMHTGLDLWAGAQSGFGVLTEKGQLYWGPSLGRAVALVALIPASWLWISSHAHRCQPGTEPGLGRPAWFAAWGLAGVVLGARCFTGVKVIAQDFGEYGDWSWRRLGLYALTGLVIPLVSYLRSSAHPLSHRPAAGVDLGTWVRVSLDTMLAVLIVWLCQACAVISASGCDLHGLVSMQGLMAACLIALWCILMSGLSLLFARGLSGLRAKFEFFTAGSLGVSLLPVLIFSCTASKHDWRHDLTFSVPSFIGFEVTLYLVALGIVALAIRRTRPKTKGKE